MPVVIVEGHAQSSGQTSWRAALLVVAVASGCSLTTTGPPEPASPRIDPSCTDSMTLPALDLIAAPLAVAGGLALGVAVGGARCGDFSPCEIPNREITAAGVVIGVVAAVVGLGGVSKVRGCRRAKRSHREWVDAGRPDDLDAHRRRIDQDACAAWRRELAGAASESDKLEIVRRRPDRC